MLASKGATKPMVAARPLATSPATMATAPEPKDMAAKVPEIHSSEKPCVLCSCTIHVSKAEYRMEVEMPPISRPSIRIQ